MGFYKLPKIIGKDQKPPLGARVNWDHPLSKGLIGAWLLNESVGSKIYSALNPKNNGIIYGATWNDDLKGSCLGFNDSDNYVDCGIVSGLADLSQASLVVIGYRSSTTDSWCVGQEASGYRFNLMWYGNSRIYIQVENTNADFPAADNSTIGWTQVVGIFNGTISERDMIYVNGIKQTLDYMPTAPTTLASAVNQSSFVMGRDITSRYHGGKIAATLLYNYALTYSIIISLLYDPYQMFLNPMWDAYYVPAAAPPPTGGKSIFGYDSIFHAGGIIQV